MAQILIFGHLERIIVYLINLLLVINAKLLRVLAGNASVKGMAGHLFVLIGDLLVLIHDEHCLIKIIFRQLWTLFRLAVIFLKF